jgi:cytochrome P450
MILYPDVQKRVQAELDAVVGRKRLPMFEDRASLPYLEATIKESLRFHPPTPLGIAHRLIEDDVVQGTVPCHIFLSLDFELMGPSPLLCTQATIFRRGPSSFQTSGR